MTPLAQAIAEELMKPLRFRRKPYNNPDASSRMRRWLENAHFFDVDKLVNGNLDLRHIDNPTFEKLYRRFFFLPAPYTWLEMRDEIGRLSAFLIMDIEKQDLEFYRRNGAEISEAAYRIFFVRHDLKVFSFGTVEPPLDSIPVNKQKYMVDEDFIKLAGGEVPQSVIKTLDWTLLLVNQPRILGMETHMAKPGFQRALAKKLGGGSFPYKGWTTLTLKVRDPELWDLEPEFQGTRETYLSARRAQHFVRKFSRIRRGKLEYVKAHWRGDPSLGMKNTRYKVELDDQPLDEK